jgi:hypothetical protein
MKKVFLICAVAVSAIALSATSGRSSSYAAASDESYISQSAVQDTTPGQKSDTTKKKKRKHDSTFVQSVQTPVNR